MLPKVEVSPRTEPYCVWKEDERMRKEQPSLSKLESCSHSTYFCLIKKKQKTKKPGRMKQGVTRDSDSWKFNCQVFACPSRNDH